MMAMENRGKRGRSRVRKGGHRGTGSTDKGGEERAREKMLVTSLLKINAEFNIIDLVFIYLYDTYTSTADLIETGLHKYNYVVVVCDVRKNESCDTTSSAEEIEEMDGLDWIQ